MNRIILMGRLTANPELKHTNSGLPVCNFSLAVNRSYVKQGEERKTDFFDIVCWRSTAEFVARYFTKGLQIAVIGKMQMRDWQDQQGNKRRSYEVVADEVFFADSKRQENGSYAPTSAYGGHASAMSEQQSAPGLPPQPAPTYRSPDTDFEELTEDDDLPF